MKKLILFVLFSLPLAASAGHMDVIEMELNEDCSMPKLMMIIKDFNKWGKSKGYQAEIAAPIQSNSLTSIFWIGRSKDTAAFGAAFDSWEGDLSNSGSAPAKLNARLEGCTTNVARRGYTLN
jgi:hypothetical protein|tara:strand:- start:95 stop:460 length:366 start_codon:yes stop_codon:yes gene_type:complete